MPKPRRQSNIELLRVLSMFLVLIVHADGASLGLPHADSPLSLSDRDAWRLGVEAVSIIGVNCFTLISGYFGISFSWRKVGAYLFQCVYFAVGIATIALFVWPSRMTPDLWWEQWLVLSHTDLWYVPAYFGLMLIAPILNAGIEKMKKNDFRWCLLLFLIFNLWCGWWWEGAFNPTGYTVVQLILVYLIGRYIRLSSGSRRNNAFRRIVYLAGYIGMTVMIYLTSVWLPDRAFAYNSPFVLGASVFLFLFFTTLSFTSPVINSLGRSAFAVYLVHKAPVIWVMLVKPTVLNVWNNTSLPLFTLFVIAGSCLVYIVAWIADKPRQLISAGIWGRG